jgi:rhodanese-related sulfurtransferase
MEFFMKKVLLAFLLTCTLAFAEIKSIPVNPEFVTSGITIIDIRTKPEWQETGILKDSIPITFFDAHGKYDAQKFLDMLSGYVKKDEEFAIICRTGNRTTIVSKFLDQMDYRVINLEGGIKALMKQGYPLSKYEQ